MSNEANHCKLRGCDCRRPQGRDLWPGAVLAGGAGSVPRKTTIKRRHKRGGVPQTNFLPLREKPADMPVQESTKVEFIINLKSAQLLGLQIPRNLLVIANEIIE